MLHSVEVGFCAAQRALTLPHLPVMMELAPGAMSRTSFGWKETAKLALQAKKAFKQLALRFHPDKAMAHCKFSVGLTPACPPQLNASQVRGYGFDP